MAARLPALCRDCGRRANGAARCAECASTRVIAHPELDDLAIAHLDCDAFYATIEKRDNPALADQPVIVGGGRRGVVAAACYVARLYGVRSAMPMFKALEACPDAVVIRPDFPKYAETGRAIRALMQRLTPLVEPLSIDEAFMDLSGTQRLFGRSPAESLAELARTIERELGVTVSIGLSYAKFLAKIASDLDKPRGFSVIGRADAVPFLDPQPVRLLWGVGGALERKLHAEGLRTIGQIRRADRRRLAGRYGPMGERLWRFARGQDDRPVTAGSVAKTVSAETTLHSDSADGAVLARALWPLCEKVSARLKQKRVAGRVVILKLKTDRFTLITRRQTLSSPTQLADRLFRTAQPLLARETDGRSFRLVGVGAADLAPEAEADPPDLLDQAHLRREAVERAMDTVRRRLGDGAIVKGRGFGPR